MAIKLRRTLPGFDNFVLYEKADDVGGTWRDNTYPGAMSDIPVHFYSLSTDLKKDWNYSHELQPQMFEYLKDLAKKYDLYSKCVFNTLVTSAQWDADKELWRVESSDTITGKTSIIEAKVLVSALGILEVPRVPDIPGISSFGGPKWHTARYNHEVDLSGKRVGVIGNGATATQLVPQISENATTHIVQFCRTSNWTMPPSRYKLSEWSKWWLQNIPGAVRFYRFLIFLSRELIYLLVWAFPLTRLLLQKRSKSYIQRVAPAKYHERLIPDYDMGCRRVIYDSGYIEALNRPNVELVLDGIDHVTEDGIVSKSGEHHQLDVLIYSTGFVSDGYPLHVKGLDTTIKKFYDAHDGPTSYMSVALPGFPNFCLIGGPNTSTGYTSVIFTHEIQINYIYKLIVPILTKSPSSPTRMSSFNVLNAPTEAYDKKIQGMARNSIFVGCNSWYRRDKSEKIYAVFPTTVVRYWWWLRQVKWEDYKVTKETMDKTA
ncbi:FAD/NAD-P-binding domain-containing protein [Cylindrobasidium torrendii FP15055 ss-10]|uniref:FAD/NAD-P-binding domain-containing protein n=1 Tax=Cylindrobasidium torrendii FP15055 ss-10 TaxID=1314674 RepID=A0A0D7BQS9_9AGAR|nr:FAD/NAD-P-binding domain-containing protein [Cylindrobasidium torrendii FP15055 ss-10]